MREHLLHGIARLSIALPILGMAIPDSAWADVLTTTGFEAVSGFLPCACSTHDKQINQPISSLSGNAGLSIHNQSSFGGGQNVFPAGNFYSASSEVSKAGIDLSAEARGGGSAATGGAYSTIITAATLPNTVDIGRSFVFAIGNTQFSYFGGMTLVANGQWNAKTTIENYGQSDAGATTRFTVSAAEYPSADLSTGNLGAPSGTTEVLGTCGVTGKPSVFPTVSSFVGIGGATIDGSCQPTSSDAFFKLSFALTQAQAADLLATKPLVLSLFASLDVTATGGFAPGQPSSVVIPSDISVDESHSLDITGFELLDSNGLVVPGFSFTSADGFNFPGSSVGPSPGGPPGGGDQGGTAVPEPAGVLLLAPGLLSLALIRRARAFQGAHSQSL